MRVRWDITRGLSLPHRINLSRLLILVTAFQLERRYPMHGKADFSCRPPLAAGSRARGGEQADFRRRHCVTFREECKLYLKQ